MRVRLRNPFTTIKTAGLLLPIDLLIRIADGDPDIPGLSPKDYHLHGSARLNEVTARAWNECQVAWKAFRKRFDTLPASDAGTTVTRDEWLLPLFQELGYGRLQPKTALKIEDKDYPVSHGWEQHVPIHLLSARYALDRRTPGVAGAATRSPYSMVQELLNRSSQHRWGFVSNGFHLFVLRDNLSLARAANVEFDLEAMMEGEVYADFQLLFLLCHQSRVEIPSDGKPDECWLEKWSSLADEQGTRAREKLRDGVEAAIKTLGAGFLETRGNALLREKLREGTLTKEDYYRQLLRLVYRFLMLLVAEEKQTEDNSNLLHPPDTPPEARERYARFYSIGRLRTLANERRGTSHPDLYESLKVLFLKLRQGYEPLGIPGLGSFLFSDRSTPDIDHASLSNEALLEAIRQLCITEDTSGRGGAVRRPVDFGNLGADELGSVYESLLELHPQIDTDEGVFTLTTAAGSERKTTGSYYTPTTLITCLLDSALEPVVEDALKQDDPEQALLNLKVCDPACGSGHFLIAAAERMAKHLARLRTGDDEPSTLEVQRAKRDIIGRCIYGVDLNPMAVELCKVSLWIEALEPGKPLSFLEHHIQCGNSLLGTTPKLLAGGIPDDAFKPLEGDDKSISSALRKRNKIEREGQMTFDAIAESAVSYGSLTDRVAGLDAIDDSFIAGVHDKEERYNRLAASADYRKARLASDAWCAAFVWRKAKDAPEPVTHDVFCQLMTEPERVPATTRAEIVRLAAQYNFFHWHLSFPDVFRVSEDDESLENKQTGWISGFDVVLGNPPWDMQEVKDNEFFALSFPDMLAVRSAKDKANVLERIKLTEPEIWHNYQIYVRLTYGQKHFMLASGRFPLSAVGRLNLYRLFLENNHTIMSDKGRVGLIIPSGFASDAFSQQHFNELHGQGRLVSLYDFENREALFPGIDRRYKFCLVTISGICQPDHITDFVFFARRVDELRDIDRHVPMSKHDLYTLNPLSSTAPLFQSTRDMLITLHLHEVAPILAKKDCNNGWQVHPTLMFMMNAAMTAHRSAEELEADGYQLQGNQYIKGTQTWLPLYEGKMVTMYDHRSASIRFDANNRVRRNQSDPLSETEHADPEWLALPMFWVDSAVVSNRCGSLPRWCLVVKDITSATNERTAIAAILPGVALTDSVPWLANTKSSGLNACLLANLDAFALDFAARQKVAGLHLRGHYLAQLPVLTPFVYAKSVIWDTHAQCLEAWVIPRILELTYTAWDLESFAKDCGYGGPPFRWDEERRFLLRCELDAAYFHLYGIERDDVDYIMETFPIVKRKDVQTHGGYRTKQVILEIYDEMAEAIHTGQSYQTRLDPPPADPRVAHPAKEPKVSVFQRSDDVR